MIFLEYREDNYMGIINQYPPFIKGLELNKGFYTDIVKPLLD